MSDPLGVLKVTTAEHPATFVEMSPWQVIPGLWLSLTTTLNVQLVLWLQSSVAVQVTVFVPEAKVAPLVGLQLTAAPLHPLATEGAE